MLLLHGTGGNERSLLDVGRLLDPNAGILSPRGNVLEGMYPRFFRRIAPQVLDLEDLRMRTDELAEFVGKAAQQYGFDADKVVAVGYSNGANIATNALMRHPNIFTGAILFHGVLPEKPDAFPDLSGKRIFISEGERDTMLPRELVDELSKAYRLTGAEVTLRWQSGGHELTEGEILAAYNWLNG